MSDIQPINCCGRDPKAYDLTPFASFVGATPVLPSLYWDVYSAEQRWKAMGKLLKKLCDYLGYMGDEINLDRDTINELQETFQEFIDGAYSDYYKQVIADWIRDNFAELFKSGIKQVFFGLTDDGYFCAYVPDSWDEIEFDTGMNYGKFDYGRLILRYNADGSGVIDNTGRYDDTDSRALTYRIKRMEDTLYTKLGISVSD